MTLLELAEASGVSLEKRGNRHWARCPFHQDSSPSFNISETASGQVWYCYGCHRGGGAVQFLQERDGLPEWEARRLWDSLCGKKRVEGDREHLYRFSETLEYCGFLKSRGISQETARRFRAGYCSDWNAALSHIGVSPEQARTLGMQDFTDCVVYPFIGRDGIYKFASRRVDEKVYWTSPESSRFFQHGLWGLQNVRGKEVWVFEGFHDAMVAFQAGYPAVAACGTHMKEEMWKELAVARIERAVFVPDADAAGRAWLEELCDSYPPEVRVEFVELESGDPDEYIRAGNSLRACKRWNAFEWWVSKKYGSPATVADKCRMLEESKSVYNRMGDLEKCVARQWYRERFGDDESMRYMLEPPLPNVEAEKIVLANCIYSEEARIEAQYSLSERDFTGKLHKDLFRMCKDPTTPQMVWMETGADFSSFADVQNCSLYIERVSRSSSQRKFFDILRTADLGDPGGTIDRIYGAYTQKRSSSGEKLLEQMRENVLGKPCRGFRVGFSPTLDENIYGYQTGKYILVSGNSGCGKTTTMCNMLEEVVDENPCLVFSLEMSGKELFQKVLSIRSGLSASSIYTQTLSPSEREEASRCLQTFSHGHLEVESDVRDLRKMQAVAKSHILKRGVKFVFVDYLQLIRLDSKDERWSQLIAVSEGMKEIASMGVCVVALSQLNSGARQSRVADIGDQAGSYGIMAPIDYGITCQHIKGDRMEADYKLFLSKSRFGLDKVEIDCKFDKSNLRIRECGYKEFL